MYVQIRFRFNVAPNVISDSPPRASFAWEERFDQTREYVKGADKPNMKACLEFERTTICTANCDACDYSATVFPPSFKKLMLKLLYKCIYFRKSAEHSYENKKISRSKNIIKISAHIVAETSS